MSTTLGSRLKELRTEKGWSQGMLAEQVGIDVTYLSKIEHGRRASEKVLRSLAEALNVELASLFGEAAGAPHPLAPPAYRTRFIDRADDMGRLRGLLEPGALVTVTGPPGGGKTRLISELANDPDWPRRPTAWITVTERDPDRIGASLALANLPRGGLLVLDDADRDRHACAATARRMIAGGVTVVATSRQALGVYGEQLLRLLPLPVPNRHQRPSRGDDLTADPGRLHEQESVKLFLDRAALARPGFQLDRANAPAVFDVCRWLDGMPLALELAALRLRQMTVADLAANTRVLLPWLTGNTPDVPDRHASMPEAIEWSFDRLPEDRRTVATRLSVLESFFSLHDAFEVASDGDDPSRDVVIATVMDLVDRSLLHWDENADGHAHYRWLRPIRQYARRRLDGQQDCSQTEKRYRSWVTQELKSLDRDLPRRESEWERLAELTPELVSTVYSLPAAEQADALAAMADALSKSLQFGNLADHVEYFAGRRFSGSGPGVFREAGTLARVRGEFESAHNDFRNAHQLALAAGDEVAQANAALDLAENASERDAYDEAVEHIDEADAIYQKLEDDRGQIEVLNLRGKVLMKQGRPAAARRPLLEALQRARLVTDSRLIAYSLHSLGTCDYLQRRVSSARVDLAESLRLRVTMRNLRGVARVVEVFALVESQVENHELVLKLLGAVRQYRHSSGMLGVSPWWRRQFDTVEQEARLNLGTTAGRAEQLLLDGAAMTLEEAGGLATAAGADGLTLPLGEPVSEPLRRALSSPFVALDLTAGVIASPARGDTPTALDLATRELAESDGTAADAYRRLHRAKLLVLAEPGDARATDLLCFALAPAVYSGVVVPVFASGRALAEALKRCPEWESRAVLEIQLDHLSSNLVRGETIVVNPWTEHEYAIRPAEQRYALSVESSSTDAPTARSRASSAS